MAKIYSIIFLVLVLLTKILSEFPNNAHNDIDGMQTNGAVTARNIVATKKFSSVGKKPETAAIATVQALGLMN